MAERLIKESDVIELIDEWLDNYPLPRHVEKGLASHEELLAYIADAPTIEAKPVVHAQWVEASGCRIICNHCGNYPLYDYFGRQKLSDICPHCGALIDESISCSHEDDKPFPQAHENGVKSLLYQWKMCRNLQRRAIKAGDKVSRKEIMRLLKKDRLKA